MPTGIQRPWSTQYSDDFNRVPWKPPIYRKKVHYNKVFKPAVPRSTDLVPPNLVARAYPYSSESYGLEDPMLDEARLNGDRDIPEYVNFCPDVNSGITVDVDDNDEDDNDMKEADPVIPEPEPIRNKNPELHWICWPEPKKGSKTPRRPYTSQGFVDARNDKVNPGIPVQYYPEIKSWTNVSAENERKAVAAMFSTLQRSQTFYEPSQKPMTSISINDPPPRDVYTKYGGQVVDPRSLYQQNFTPYYQSRGAGPRDSMNLQQLAGHINPRNPPSQMSNYNYSFNKYPLHMRKNRRSVAATDEYVHEQSMFMTTAPKCVGHFIIHPDWVSERSGLRRSKSMIQLERAGRY